MQKLRVHNFSISIDGCAAGPTESADNPLVLAAPDRQLAIRRAHPFRPSAEVGDPGRREAAA